MIKIYKLENLTLYSCFYFTFYEFYTPETRYIYMLKTRPGAIFHFQNIFIILKSSEHIFTALNLL